MIHLEELLRTLPQRSYGHAWNNFLSGFLARNESHWLQFKSVHGVFHKALSTVTYSHTTFTTKNLLPPVVFKRIEAMSTI